MMFKLQTIIIIGIIVTAVAGAVYYYHTTTTNKIEALQEANAEFKAANKQYEQAAKENERAFEELEREQERIRREYNELSDEFGLIELQNSELRSRLDRHDIGALGAAKPDLVERTINNAANSVNRCFEILSGSPVKESDRNNRECPWLVEGQ